MKKQTTNKKAEASKKSTLSVFVSVLVWLVGIIVALAVGSGMVNRTLTIPYIPTIITEITGWVVVLGAILSLILAIFDR